MFFVLSLEFEVEVVVVDLEVFDFSGVGVGDEAAVSDGIDDISQDCEGGFGQGEDGCSGTIGGVNGFGVVGERRADFEEARLFEVGNFERECGRVESIGGSIGVGFRDEFSCAEFEGFGKVFHDSLGIGLCGEGFGDFPLVVVIFFDFDFLMVFVDDDSCDEGFVEVEDLVGAPFVEVFVEESFERLVNDDDFAFFAEVEKGVDGSGDGSCFAERKCLGGVVCLECDFDARLFEAEFCDVGLGGFFDGVDALGEFQFDEGVTNHIFVGGEVDGFFDCSSG